MLDVTEKNSREQFIRSYLSFIRQTAARQTGKVLEWGRDEELSIALIAFNAAIDAFKIQKGANFNAFSAMIIKRRLIDYYRTRSRQLRKEFPLGDQLIFLADSKNLREGKLNGFLAMERKWEIKLFLRELQSLGISLTDLVRQAPKQTALRNRMLKAAKDITGNGVMSIGILKSGRLPLDKASKLTGIHRSIISKRRKYLIAVILVFAHRADYPFISTYLNGGEN